MKMSNLRYSLLMLFCINAALSGCKKHEPLPINEQEPKIETDSKVPEIEPEDMSPEMLKAFENAVIPVPAWNTLLDSDGNLIYPNGRTGTLKTSSNKMSTQQTTNDAVITESKKKK